MLRLQGMKHHQIVYITTMLSLVPPVSVPVDKPSPSHEGMPIIDIRSIYHSTTGAALEDGIRASIVTGLTHSYNEKVLPGLLLYNEEGLRLFEQMTYQPDYYLTGLEIDILSKYATEIANDIPEGALLLELGAGCVVTPLHISATYHSVKLVPSVRQPCCWMP